MAPSGYPFPIPFAKVTTKEITYYIIDHSQKMSTDIWGDTMAFKTPVV